MIKAKREEKLEAKPEVLAMQDYDEVECYGDDTE